MGKKKMLMRKFGSIAIVNNTFIGGVASVINTPTLLAAKLKYYPSGAAFSENDIQNFTIIGDDIECYIGVNYQIKQNAFQNTGFATSNPVYYKDEGSKCKQLQVSSFYGSLNTSNFYFPAVVSVLNGCFYHANYTNLQPRIIYLPICTSVSGDPTVIDTIQFGFGNITQKLYIGIFNKTSNNGGINATIAHSIANDNLTVSWVENLTKPNQVTDLSVNTVYATAIKLDWSVPTSTNAIDFYEVYVDGVFYENSSTNEIIVTGLTNLQTYNFSVVAVDIFYNKSEMSNVVTQQINGVDVYKITDLTATTVYATAIKLDCSIPTSTNAIDFYEVYVDGVFYENSSTNEIIVTGLTNLQTYNFSVVAVDIFYNKSEMSNVVTQQINGVGREWLDNIISYYKFENNVLDSVGTNNGVATDITYESGQVGNAAVFNGSTSFINCGNPTNLQSYPISIVTVIKTSNAGSSYRGLVVKQYNYALYLSNNVLIYYDWDTTTTKNTGINLADNNYHTVIKTIDALGNVNIYVDAVLLLTDTITLVNANEDLVIGAGNSDGSIQNFNGSMDDTALLNKELSQTEVTEIDALLMAGFPLI